MVFRPLKEGFDAWIGWSANGKYPYPLAQKPGVGASDPRDFSAPMAMFLTIVLANRQGAAFWSFWQPKDSWIDDPAEYGKRFTQYYLRTSEAEGAREAVEEPIRQSILEIREFGIPYLQSRVAC